MRSLLKKKEDLTYEMQILALFSKRSMAKKQLISVQFHEITNIKKKKDW
jgi:hypothetical protein